jgi:hypothetical protein
MSLRLFIASLLMSLRLFIASLLMACGVDEPAAVYGLRRLSLRCL